MDSKNNLLFYDDEGKLTDSSENLRYLNLIRNAICYNQEELIQFVLLASEINRDINELRYLTGKSDLSEKQKKIKELENLFTIRLKSIYERNFDFLRSYFIDRPSISMPRICIKVFKEEPGSSDKVITLMRDHKYKQKGKPTSVKLNTATLATSQGKKYYICNDIPREFKLGIYRNERIDDEIANSYTEPQNHSSGFDYDWVECWKKIKGSDINQENEVSPPPETCYKSTLVIPMSLNNRRLDIRFLNSFNIDKTTERTVYGFLCLDHTEKEYFLEKKDVDVGYIFADIMSLYLITQIRYSDILQTDEKNKDRG